MTIGPSEGGPGRDHVSWVVFEPLPLQTYTPVNERHKGSQASPGLLPLEHLAGDVSLSWLTKEDYRLRKASKSDHWHGSQRLILREREKRTGTQKSVQQKTFVTELLNSEKGFLKKQRVKLLRVYFFLYFFFRQKFMEKILSCARHSDWIYIVLYLHGYGPH